MESIRSSLTIFLTLLISCGPLCCKPIRYSGEKTVLVIDADQQIRRLDGDDLRHTRICLLSKNGAILFECKVDDEYACIGYSRIRHAFVMQTLGQEGASLLVDSFQYLAEEKPAIVSSKSFTHQFIADTDAIIPSPDLRFIVFVGRRARPSSHSDWGLYVLDTKSDTIRLLGKAPDPPPFSNKELKAARGLNSSENLSAEWVWGLDSTDSKLEPNICQFVSRHILQVSYGRDTCMQRSKHRFVRKWIL